MFRLIVGLRALRYLESLLLLSSGLESPLGWGHLVEILNLLNALLRDQRAIHLEEHPQ